MSIAISLGKSQKTAFFGARMPNPKNCFSNRLILGGKREGIMYTQQGRLYAGKVKPFSEKRRRQASTALSSRAVPFISSTTARASSRDRAGR